LMIPRCKFSDIRKIHILCRQKSFFHPRRVPDVTVKLPVRSIVV
jgi:hypothetical protein